MVYKKIIHNAGQSNNLNDEQTEYAWVLLGDIVNYFKPFRKKRKEPEANPEYIKKVLSEGAEKARVIVLETTREVKEKVGLVLK